MNIMESEPYARALENIENICVVQWNTQYSLQKSEEQKQNLFNLKFREMVNDCIINQNIWSKNYLKLFSLIAAFILLARKTYLCIYFHIILYMYPVCIVIFDLFFYWIMPTINKIDTRYHRECYVLNDVYNNITAIYSCANVPFYSLYKTKNRW